MQFGCQSAQGIYKPAVLSICLLAIFFCTIPANGGNVHKRRIVSSVVDLAGAAISPGGSKVAIYVTTRLDIYDVSSLSAEASVALPVLAKAGDRFHWSDLLDSPGWFHNNSRVRYCDHGRYILVYGDSGIFFVVDAISYRRAGTITLDPPDAKTGHEDIAVSCAAESNIVAVEVATTPFSIGPAGLPTLSCERATIKVFAIDTGKQLSEISQGSSLTDSWGDVEVSPSGSHALIYGAGINGCSKGQNITVLDIGSSTVSTSFDAGFTIGQASFVDESSIAVAGASFGGVDAPVGIKIFDAQTAALVKQIGDSKDAPHEVVEASADGRFLFAYTGKENHCEECGKYSRGNLIITRAEFTVWDLTTGKIIAKSSVPASTENGRIAMFWGEPAGRSSSRPHFQFSQSGNAILVTGTRDEFAVDVYLLK